MKKSLIVLAAIVAVSSLASARPGRGGHGGHRGGHHHGGGHHGGGTEISDGEADAISAGLGVSLISSALSDDKVILAAKQDAIQFVAMEGNFESAALSDAFAVIRAKSQVELSDAEVLAAILSAE